MCGENQTRQLHRFRLIGSPPHVRGKLSPRNNTIASHGITPACARKTQGQTPSKNGDKDHPRMCGENPTYQQPDVHRLGSPPHVRGKPMIRCLQPQKTGITPACAGKTFTYCSRDAYCRDHPRMCGENIDFNSSREFLIWITPACAGKTPMSFSAFLRPRDHPRMCGENPRVSKVVSGNSGSPPHVRGKRKRETRS